MKSLLPDCLLSSQCLRHIGTVSLLVIVSSCAPPKSEPEVDAPMRDVGIIRTEADGEDCPASSCSSFEVRCEHLAEPASGRMVVSAASGTYRGTIVIFSGGGGTSLWGTRGEDTTRYQEVLANWGDAGFRVVQVQWSENWWNGAAENEGFAALACRPATLTQWIADNLTEASAPLCVGGGSGGAGQTSYMLTHYGLEDRISLAVPWSGFWMGRIDTGCLDADPRNALLHYDDRARRAIDLSYGFGSDEWVRSGEPAEMPAGPCSTRDPSFEAAFAEASIAATGDYNYPHTLVWHILAGADEVGGLAQGLTYYEEMVRAGTPHVRLDVLPGAPHGLAREEAGLGKIRDVFLLECKVR